MQHIYDMPQSGSFRTDQLRDELLAAGITPEPPHLSIDIATDNISVLISGVSNEDGVLATPIVAAHIPVQFYTDRDRAIDNYRNVSAYLMDHLVDVVNQSPQDAAFAILARAIAHEAGEPEIGLRQIVDRQSAEEYVAQMPEWLALPQSSRDFMSLQLRGTARVLQLLHIVLLSHFEPSI